MPLQYNDTEEERTYIVSKELLIPNISRFETEISSFVKNDSRDIVLDFIKISKIDSMSIPTLIRIKNMLTENNRNLKLINPSEAVMKVLEMAGLESFLLEE